MSVSSGVSNPRARVGRMSGVWVETSSNVGNREGGGHHIPDTEVKRCGALSNAAHYDKP